MSHIDPYRMVTLPLAFHLIIKLKSGFNGCDILQRLTWAKDPCFIIVSGDGPENNAYLLWLAQKKALIF